VKCSAFIRRAVALHQGADRRFLAAEGHGHPDDSLTADDAHFDPRAAVHHGDQGDHSAGRKVDMADGCIPLVEHVAEREPDRLQLA
jgi:hypothetical protein